MANASQFLGKYQGQFVNSCGGIQGQCVAEVQLFSQENGVGGCPIFNVAAAKDMANARPDSFDWIPNSPSGVPIDGDIMVWNGVVGPWGHTAIFYNGNSSTFKSVDQNWPTGSPVHLQDHNYNGVIGWLRLKNNNVNPTPTPGGGGDQMAETTAQVEQRLLHGPGGIDEWTNKFSAAQAQVQQLGDRVNEMQKTLDTANGLITKLQSDNNSAALAKQVADLQKQIADLQNSTPTTLDSFSLGQLLSAAFSKLFKIK